MYFLYYICNFSLYSVVYYTKKRNELMTKETPQRASPSSDQKQAEMNFNPAMLSDLKGALKRRNSPTSQQKAPSLTTPRLSSVPAFASKSLPSVFSAQQQQHASSSNKFGNNNTRPGPMMPDKRQSAPVPGHTNKQSPASTSMLDKRHSTPPPRAYK